MLARALPWLSAHRLFYKCDNPCLFGWGQLLQRERGRPHGTFIKIRRVAEAQRCVPRVELLRALEEADDLAVPGIRVPPPSALWRAPSSRLVPRR